MSFYQETNTKYITSDQFNSPLLINEYGSLNALLKNVLTEGFNEVTVVSVESTDQVFIIKLPINHGYIKNQVVALSGAIEDLLNKEYRITKSTSDSITILKPIGYVGDSITTETSLKLRVSPLGYDIVYENTEEGILCFQNKSVSSPAILKTIDKLPPNDYLNTWAKYARVVIGNEIDSQGNFVDNIKAPFHPAYPDAEKTGNGVLGDTGVHGFAKWEYSIYPGNYENIENRLANGVFPTDWRVIGDNKTFYIMIRSMGKNKYNFNLLGFGNFKSYDDFDTTNICLQAKDGFISANATGDYSASRTRSYFGALNYRSSGFLFKDIYGSHKSNYNRHYNISNFLGATNRERPWHNTEIKSLNPVTGMWVTGFLYIKDYDNFIRGYHRGIKILYGVDRFPDELIDSQGNIILYVQEPINTNGYGNIPMLFSLKNWEEV